MADCISASYSSHHAELGDPAPADGELVQVEHDIRLIARGSRGDGPRLGRAQQQVVAVHVDAAGVTRTKCSAPSGLARGTIEHVDPSSSGAERGRREARGDRERGFAAGGLVAVLLADHHHGRPRGIDDAALGEHDERHRAALLRHADPLDAHVGRGARELGEVRLHFRMRGKIGAARAESRRRVARRGIRISRGDGGRLRGDARRIEIGAQVRRAGAEAGRERDAGAQGRARLRAPGAPRGPRSAHDANARSARRIVSAMSASPCAADTKPAS